jgi:hypothetical protein
MKYFQRVQVPYVSRDIGEALASGKLVVGNDSSEGSQTANSGTDEQKLDMRLNKPDEQAHHCDVPKPEKESVY